MLSSAWSTLVTIMELGLNINMTRMLVRMVGASLLAWFAPFDYTHGFTAPIFIATILIVLGYSVLVDWGFSLYE